MVGQARNSDSPFDITDMSIKEPISTNWNENARRRIKGCDIVIVICGTYTDTASGVSAELKLAQEEGIDYFLLGGYNDRRCVKPKSARDSDKIYRWTWDILKELIGGAR